MDDNSISEHKTIRSLLEHLDFREVCPSENEEWHRLEAIDSEFGTTDETKFLLPGAGEKHVKLVDAHTDERLASARKAPPREENTQKREFSREHLEDLMTAKSHPNTRTAAFLASLHFRRAISRGDGEPSHEAIVTSSNLLVLKAWNEGISLLDFDKITFESSEDGPTMQIRTTGADASVSVPVVERSLALEEPWNGEYSFLKVNAKEA